MRSIVLVLCLVGCTEERARLSDADRDRALASLNAMRLRGTMLDAAREAATRPEAAVGPRPDLGPCPLTIARQILGPRWPNLKRDLERYESILKEGRFAELGEHPSTDLTRTLGALDDPSKWDLDLILVISHQVPPRTDVAGFTPGQVRGRLLVWSYTEHKVVCAGDVQAQNSSTVNVHFNGGIRNDLELQLNLARDLDSQALASGLAHLSRAGKIDRPALRDDAPLIGTVQAKPPRCGCTLVDQETKKRLLLRGEVPTMNLRGADVRLSVVRTPTSARDSHTEEYAYETISVKAEWFFDEVCGPELRRCNGVARAIITVDDQKERKRVVGTGSCGGCQTAP
jgi:hypothetical protein